MDGNQKNEQVPDRSAKASTHLLDIARQAMHKLVPSKTEISEITSSASEWLAMLHVLLPQPFVARSGREINDSYEEMCRPDVDTMSLASWLLCVAITAQQIPQQHDNSFGQPREIEGRLKLSKAISDTVGKYSPFS